MYGLICNASCVTIVGSSLSVLVCVCILLPMPVYMHNIRNATILRIASVKYDINFSQSIPPISWPPLDHSAGGYIILRLCGWRPFPLVPSSQQRCPNLTIVYRVVQYWPLHRCIPLVRVVYWPLSTQYELIMARLNIQYNDNNNIYRK